MVKGFQGVDRLTVKSLSVFYSMVPLHLKIPLHEQIDAPGLGNNSVLYLLSLVLDGKISGFPFKCGAVDMLAQVFLVGKPVAASKISCLIANTVSSFAAQQRPPCSYLGQRPSLFPRCAVMDSIVCRGVRCVLGH